MYLKELKHIVSMNKRIKKLEPFKKLFLGRTFDSEAFIYKNEEELFLKSITNVNEAFNIIFKRES